METASSLVTDKLLMVQVRRR